MSLAKSHIAQSSVQKVAHATFSLERVRVRPGLQNRARISLRRSYAVQINEEEKPFTLDAFYDEILRHPTPQKTGAPPLDPNNPPKTPSLPEQTPQDRARIVFGSRLASPVDRRRELERKSTMIAGVMVPPRPEEPDNCCMSGCVNCVWDQYRDEIEDWAEKSAEAKERIKAKATSNTTSADVPPSADQSQTVDHTMTSMDDDGGGSEALWSSPSNTQDFFEGIPVGIREFMRTEKRLKQEKAAAGIDKF